MTTCSPNLETPGERAFHQCWMIFLLVMVIDLFVSSMMAPPQAPEGKPGSHDKNVRSGIAFWETQLGMTRVCCKACIAFAVVYYFGDSL